MGTAGESWKRDRNDIEGVGHATKYCRKGKSWEEKEYMEGGMDAAHKIQERELSGKQDRSKMLGQKENEEIIKENRKRKKEIHQYKIVAFFCW